MSWHAAVLYSYNVRLVHAVLYVNIYNTNMRSFLKNKKLCVSYIDTHITQIYNSIGLTKL